LLLKSFSDVKNCLLDLSVHVPDLDEYLAHLPAVNPKQEKEKLQGHIVLVNETALRLIDIYGLEGVINNLIINLLKQLNCEQAETGNFIKELFLASIGFHDFGKLNENFQVERMKNNHFKKVNLQIGSQHSILSAFLFLNYYLKELEKLSLPNNLASSFAGIICAFADPILKHHSSTLDIGDLDKERCKELCHFLPLVGMNSHATYWPNVLQSKRTFEEDIFADISTKEPFTVYTLIKLNFSLLTAADYLSTLSYQYEFSIPDKAETLWYGILSLSDKKELYERFKQSAKYNCEALEEPEPLARISISGLQDISNGNLNKLRSRMLGEVVCQVKKHPTKRLFYLKAPTGGGKTNISLAAALEMLHQDDWLNKIFYVFPFTTLITQTYNSIKKTLKLDESQVIQLHSKAEWHEKNIEANADGVYGSNWENHIDNLFVQYPIVLLSHIRFFDILKSNRKEINYLLHRIANSIVIIDELQSYSPNFWEHINYFLTKYSDDYNIRFILMSATLPEIGALTIDNRVEWVQLLEQPENYFQNPNFSKRAAFDFTFLENNLSNEKEQKLKVLADFIGEKTEAYANNHEGRVKALVEFITKKSAAEFLKVTNEHDILRYYEVLILTGTILEPRRQEIIRLLKNKEWLRANPKMLLISTQVVEAGVDIDMDIGFKDTSLIDSDEQLAGRVNRNAINTGNVVHLFHLDGEGIVYKQDERLRIQRSLSAEERKRVYQLKEFNLLYDKIIDKLIKEKTEGIISSFRQYKEYLEKLSYKEVDREFQLIKDQTKSVFIPLPIPLSAFTEKEKLLLQSLNIFSKDESVSGKDVFKAYENIVKSCDGDFIHNRDSLRQIQSLLSKFTISVYPQTADTIKKQIRTEVEIEKYGFIYWADYHEHYSYKTGLKLPAYQCDFL
jgi:CRISPR-associated endonuclease/helicase Cas3